MSLDNILLRLTEPLESREDALVLGRMGFLEWLVSVPDEGDFTQQAELAHERAAPLKLSVPAISVFCDLLLEAALNTTGSEERSGRKNSRINRRTGAPRRRTLH
ncbi:hypothetical protein [Granulosicoccus antarcticus]|uniref:Uncharacterized protein n=1 Tax=Granulosicoccus antarcticus IMCC3135 TaxID=1192854 RepID=A0A2Z2NVK3_9GAMM|nr:hypothetical protein [Granulosicoccus antarcticus]ASJ71184.1 hypothetical protein IMCC3135_05360 [Granulosicoccus antarcticus IMCC3135]